MKKLIALILIGMMLVGCSTESTEGAETRDYNWGISIWTDSETGVQYVCYCTGHGNGITPRLNADGTVMVEEVTE